jgi:hypothetical protein
MEGTRFMGGVTTTIVFTLESAYILKVMMSAQPPYAMSSSKKNDTADDVFDDVR